MAAMFWLFILGAGVVTGQPWAFLVLAALLMCLARTRPARPIARPAPPPARLSTPAPSRPARAPQPAAPAPVAQVPPVDPRQLKRRWRDEDLQSWQEDFDRLLAAAVRRPDLPDRLQRRT